MVRRQLCPTGQVGDYQGFPPNHPETTKDPLGLGDFDPMSEFTFNLDVKPTASDEAVAEVRKLTNERCPAIWAMNNPVPHHIEVSISI